MAQQGEFLPMIHLRGTHYQVGFGMGKTMREQIQTFFRDFIHFKNVLMPFIETDDGRAVYEKYLNGTNQYLPQYIDEIRGLADGSGIPFNQIFLLHIMNEVEIILAGKQDSGKSCSTVFVKNPHSEILAHNEDGDPEMQDACFLVAATIVDENDCVIEKFTSFVYPGILPGVAFAYNHHRMIFTINSLSPTRKPSNSIPEDIFLRSFLRASSFEELEEMIRTIPGSAQSSSLNVASTKTHMMANYEFYPPNIDGLAFDRQSVTSQYSTDDEILPGNGYLFHFNKYERILEEQESQNITSSIHRDLTAKREDKPSTVKDVKAILGNNVDNEYPIFRRPTEMDQRCTIATAVFDLKEMILSVFRSNPINSKPLLVLPL